MGSPDWDDDKWEFFFCFRNLLFVDPHVLLVARAHGLDLDTQPEEFEINRLQNRDGKTNFSTSLLLMISWKLNSVPTWWKRWSSLKTWMMLQNGHGVDVDAGSVRRNRLSKFVYCFKNRARPINSPPKDAKIRGSNKLGIPAADFAKILALFHKSQGSRAFLKPCPGDGMPYLHTPNKTLAQSMSFRYPPARNAFHETVKVGIVLE